MKDLSDFIKYIINHSDCQTFNTKIREYYYNYIREEETRQKEQLQKLNQPCFKTGSSHNPKSKVKIIESDDGRVIIASVRRIR